MIRLVLKLLGANPNAGFASFTYGVTNFLLAPFHGLLPTIVSGRSVFELSLIFAILIYSLLALGLARIVAITLSKSVTVSQHSHSEGLRPGPTDSQLAVSTIRRRHIGTTIWTLLISVATAVTLLLAITAVVLVAMSPNWFGR